MKLTNHEPAEGTLPVFASLSVRNYRQYFIGALISNNGTWMQRIAQDWLVFTLTGSGLAVGITMALQFGPMLVLGLYGGVLGYLDFAGNADFAIAIRTALMRGGTAYVQAGGGVVADSNGPYEYNESSNKAKAVLAAKPGPEDGKKK